MRINGIGLMCGTSLDGLDIAHCTFNRQHNRWTFNCNACQEIPLPKNLNQKLEQSTELAGSELVVLDDEVGQFFGNSVASFLNKQHLHANFIASHGVTVFHQPENGFTKQIGSGQAIANKTGIVTVTDFRSEDVAKGGQGAPLVPYPDSILFSAYDATLNLGGFANVAILNQPNLLGFDITVCNKILNHLACQHNGSEYDSRGEIALAGSVNQTLLNNLNSLSFYAMPPPKSLGHEWYLSHFLPLFDNGISTTDKMRTAVEHIAQQIGKQLPANGKTLCTGGGAFNQFLVSRIEHFCQGQIKIPDDKLISFKEAIDFAFLGALKFMNKINVKASVTGASSNTCAGKIYNP